jgi:competence protein ComFC
MNPVVSPLKPWLEAGLAFLYPEACQICHERRAEPAEGLVCSRCWSQVRFIKPPFCDRCGRPFEGALTTAFECTNCREIKLHFSSARSAVVAGGVVRETIHRYKYQQAMWFEPFLAELLLREALPALRESQWDCVVPVPLYPTKERAREFNQAERLGAHLAGALKIPLNKTWLRRVLFTSTQTRLTREQRAANVRRAFAVRDGAKLDGQRVILVDDVFTTGATTSACAKVLLDAGAGEVCVWTVARGV